MEKTRADKGLVGLLVKVFIKNSPDVKNTKVRLRYGNLSSFTGIIVNVMLFVAKFIIGTLSGSVSIVGDAVNNLSDAGSSVISLVSFKMAAKPADNNHPFGHARIEYIASSIVSVVILFIGFELVKTSIEKIDNPEIIHFSIITIIVLVLSILTKLWLYSFNRRLGKHIGSALMQATAVDSLSDMLATSTVLISVIVSKLTGVQLDGYMGIAVAAFILYSGYKILRETINRILGQGPSKELIKDIESYIRKYDGVIGIHDLVVHDYGPQHTFASVHVEVDSNVDILVSHDLIDNIERNIALDLGIHLVIHLDPLVMDDPFVTELYEMTKKVVAEVDNTLSIHDFRVVEGSAHNNMIFDVNVPYECKKSDKKIQQEIVEKISEINNRLYVVLTLDRSYISTTNQKTIN